MSTTPSPQTFVSKVVKVVGTTRYNGDVGLCLSFSEERNRYSVKLDAATISVKGENLLVANVVEKAKYGIRDSLKIAQQLFNDPYLRQQVRQAYTTAASMLPTYLPPERLALLLALLVILLIRSIGFLKSFVIFSLVMLPVSVSLKDIFQDINIIRKPMVLIKRFPLNMKNSIVEATGFSGVSEKMALAIFGFFFVLALQMLLTPAEQSKLSAGSSMHPPTDLKEQLRELYKLGFEDGTHGKDYGSALTGGILEDYSSSIGGTMKYSGKHEAESFDWSHEPPQKTSIWRRLNLRTVMTLVTIIGILFKPGRRRV
mmetsp:Transcript_3378/g.4999  ORF Transcript_3378/g.4999 Transcript_3378/m.4999 type:complete len:314 (-) Transcript_3378:1375-2316(-)